MKNPEELIGKKVYGFRYESEKVNYDPEFMELYIGKIGEVIKTYRDGTCVIDFGEDYFFYPTDQVEAHLVEEENEIPALTDGVIMWVSDNCISYELGEVFFKHDGKYYAKRGLSFEPCDSVKQVKPIPTKEEQLTAILGSSEKVAEIMELFKSE